MGDKVRVSPIMSNVHPMLNQLHPVRKMALPTPRAPKNKVRTAPPQPQTTGTSDGN
jgi:hypothetical protein